MSCVNSSRKLSCANRGTSGEKRLTGMRFYCESGRKHLLCSDHSISRSTKLYSTDVFLTVSRTLLVRPWRGRSDRAVTRKAVLKIKALPWLRRLVAGLLSWRPGLNPGLVHVGFVVEKVSLEQAFIRVLGFWPVNIPPWLSILMYHMGDEQ
jgi:hypothetical protein